MKSCKDCVHHKHRFFGPDRCRHPYALVRVGADTFAQNDAASMRRQFAACGPDAVLFERRAARAWVAAGRTALGVAAFFGIFGALLFLAGCAPTHIVCGSLVGHAQCVDLDAAPATIP